MTWKHTKLCYPPCVKSYDSRLGALSRELVATDDRWKEVNHLLLSGQKVAKHRGGAAGKGKLLLVNWGSTSPILKLTQNLSSS